MARRISPFVYDQIEELCKTLGVRSELCTGLSLQIAPSELPRLTVEYALRDDEISALKTWVKRFDLVDIDAPIDTPPIKLPVEPED